MPVDRKTGEIISPSQADGREQTALTAADTLVARSEIDMQVATAKRYPRSIVEFRNKAMEMATLDEETAGSMFYVLPRAGKKIEGPSVRLAEIVASAWKNIRFGARAVERGDRYVTAQGVCYDLENNVYASFEVRRRITKSDGTRYDDDLITVTENAAASIAFRQAVFKVVPMAYIRPIYEESKRVSLGKGLTMEQRRTRALEWFTKLGAKPEQVLQILDRKGVADITVDDLVELQGIKTAIMDGETTIEAILRESQETGVTAGQPRKSSLDLLADRMEEKKNGNGKPAATAAPVSHQATPGGSPPAPAAAPAEQSAAQVTAPPVTASELQTKAAVQEETARQDRAILVEDLITKILAIETTAKMDADARSRHRTDTVGTDDLTTVDPAALTDYLTWLQREKRWPEEKTADRAKTTTTPGMSTTAPVSPLKGQVADLMKALKLKPGEINYLENKHLGPSPDDETRLAKLKTELESLQAMRAAAGKR